MTKYYEILRLPSLEFRQKNIDDSSNVSKKMVNRVLKRAKELNIFRALDANDTDNVLIEKIFPVAKQPTSHKQMSDFAYIRKDLICNGVSKKLFVIVIWRIVVLTMREQFIYS